MAKSKAPKRGATPLPTKQPTAKRQLPKIQRPALPWSWLLGAGVAFGLVFGVMWSYQHWPINTIQVEGRLQIWSQEQIIEQLDGVQGTSFFALNVNDVHKKIQSLPLVAQVTVRKRWPNTLVVDITEDVPVALWNGNKLLSANGVLSRIPAGLATDQLIKMQGPEQQVIQAARTFRRIQQTLHGLNVQVVQLTITAVNSVQVQLSNGWEVEFGRQYFEDRILRLKKLIQYFPANKISKIDLRYGKGAAISWRQEQEIG